MRISVVFAADTSSDFQIAPDHNGGEEITYKKGMVMVPSGFEAIEPRAPSDRWPGGWHEAYSGTVNLAWFLKFIEKYQLFSIDDIGHNMAIRLSNAGYGTDRGSFSLYAIPELEEGMDFSGAWRQVVNAIGAGAKNAELKNAPQPLKSKGGNADAVPNTKRLQPASRHK